ncbi:long-chain-fatty-acid--CoA ligase [Oceanicola sp. S124]|uniref:long-chain-fatty-acid--CoA ligase n=1 Tax=Oceanicola sp. S124 TaxID=1042378 RepID=UPI000255790F|nr:long-chain-fatty-acid--CoA ligase [Oceanicola sp. S124]
MADMLHRPHWPEGLPWQVDFPTHSVALNLAASALKAPGRVALHFHGHAITYGDLWADVERLAGWLQAQGVRRGDRVLLYMQNAPQHVIAYYAILRADAVVVPVNPMNRGAELDHLARDTGARIAIAGTELLCHIQPLIGTGLLDQVLVAAYADMTDPEDAVPLFEAFLGQTDADVSGPGLTGFRAALAENHTPRAIQAGPDDMAVIPYSSGTTGQPKGCVHTHASVQATIQGGALWNPADGTDEVHLTTLPLFHVTGMQNGMSIPLLKGQEIVLLCRWSREAACALIARHRVTRWRSIATMAIDLLNTPGIERHDLSSLRGIGGGGAAMPEAVADRLHALTGLDYIEGYGLSETIAATHINPMHRPKRQCLGIPVMNVDSRIIDPVTLKELPAGETGEIVTHGPQVFQGYWQREDETRAAFLTIEGKRFFRTGDLGYRDAEGYFFMVDRVKRMINASGFKVWPAEVEALMHAHPDLSEVCIIGAPDPRRGETVKAVAVPRAGAEGLTEAQVIDWCHSRMAAYKCPKSVEFTEALPKSAAGKVLWRELAEKEATRAAQPAG